MWTLCYDKLYDGHLCADHWLRFETRDELARYLEVNSDLITDEDALIFPPEADDLAMKPAALFEK